MILQKNQILNFIHNKYAMRTLTKFYLDVKQKKKENYTKHRILNNF